MGVRTVTNYVYDEANQLVTTTAGTAVTTYTFDANGIQRSEVIGAGARVTYTWDPRNLLTNYVAPSGQIATYTHRYDDLRATLDPGDGSAATFDRRRRSADRSRTTAPAPEYHAGVTRPPGALSQRP